MPRKAARDGLPGGPGWAWAAVLRREADQVQGARRGLGAWAAAGRLGAWAAAGHGAPGAWLPGADGRGATQSPYTVTHGVAVVKFAADWRHPYPPHRHPRGELHQ